MAKVLLVEDDNNLREIYQARLSAEGYDIATAQNGKEALVVAKQQKPDLIISDVMMPRISGFEMLDILRNTSELKATKVIMLTALGQAEDQTRANNLGADKYLIKSQVTLEDIVNAAKELLIEDGVIAAPAPVVPATPATVPEPVTPTAAPAAMPVATPPQPTPTPAPAPAPVATTMPPPAAAVPAPPAPAPAPEPTAAASPVMTPSSVPADATAITLEPAEPAPTPAPISTPAATDTTSSAQAAVTNAASQTLEAEEAALQAQIENYSKAPAEAALAVTPEAVPPAPAPAEAPQAAPTADAATASNDQAIAKAVEELNTPVAEAPIQPPSVVNAPEPAPVAAPVAAPAPVQAPASAVETPAVPPAVPATPASESVTVAGKKIIQPIDDAGSKTNLTDLLAQEAAKQPVPTPAPGNTAAPAQPFDPNSAL